MFSFAVLILVYSYAIFTLGIVGFINTANVLTLTLVAILCGLYLARSYLGILKDCYRGFIDRTLFERALIICLLLQAVVNFVGALGPELAFDSLWYHLTLPKIYLMEEKIEYMPGGVFYYSVMPKLIEMVYVGAISIGQETLAKIVHFMFGILSLVVLYKLAIKFVPKKIALVVLVIFYSNLVVGWLSITAYIDLARVFFEVLAFYYFVEYLKEKNNKKLIFSAVSLGVAIATKVLALESLLIFLPLIIISTKSFKKALMYTAISLIVPMPWFVFSYINTGNPVYPFFSGIYEISPSVGASGFINFFYSADPISPIYVILLPVVFYIYGKLSKTEKLVLLYCALSFVVWLLTPQTGGGRYIVSYLAIYSLAAGITIHRLGVKFVKNYILGLVLIISLSSIAYRGAANVKYLPVILGIEEKSVFLSSNLNFDFGDFYDTDGYFKKNIKENDKVLIYGIHNLYYANFPFIHESYVKKGDKFNHVLIRGSLPERFESWELVYENKLTNVKLYSNGGRMWEY